MLAIHAQMPRAPILLLASWSRESQHRTGWGQCSPARPPRSPVTHCPADPSFGLGTMPGGTWPCGGHRCGIPCSHLLQPCTHEGLSKEGWGQPASRLIPSGCCVATPGKAETRVSFPMALISLPFPKSVHGQGGSHGFEIVDKEPWIQPAWMGPGWL